MKITEEFVRNFCFEKNIMTLIFCLIVILISVVLLPLELKPVNYIAILLVFGFVLWFTVGIIVKAQLYYGYAKFHLFSLNMLKLFAENPQKAIEQIKAEYKQNCLFVYQAEGIDSLTADQAYRLIKKTIKDVEKLKQVIENSWIIKQLKKREMLEI